MADSPTTAPLHALSFYARLCRAMKADLERAWQRRSRITTWIAYTVAAIFVVTYTYVAWRIAGYPVQNVEEVTSQGQLLLAAFNLAPTTVVAFAAVSSARASTRAVEEMRRSREQTDRSELLAETRAAISAVRLGLNRAVIYAPPLAVSQRSWMWWGRSSLMFRQMSQLQQAAVEVSTGMNQLALLDEELAEVAGIALDEVLALIEKASAGATQSALEESAMQLHRVTQRLETLVTANTRVANANRNSDESAE